MAYKLQEQKIIPGGLNLLAPGDQVASGDCLNLSEWWAGSAGRLEQAPGPATMNNPSVTSAQDSVCKVDSRIYYGGGGNLRQIGRSGDAAIISGLDGYPIGLLSYQGYLWGMNRKTSGTSLASGKGQFKDDGTTVSDWTPAAPSAPTLADMGTVGDGGNPPNNGGLFNKEYTYYISLQSILGETNPSAGATITPAVDDSIVRITPGAFPAGTTGWNIYRKSPDLAYAYRLNENVIGVARTYVDDYGNEVHTHSDTQIQQLGIIMESDHDAAPPARVLANQVYNGRILAANSASHPNRIWYTQSLQPAFFRGSANENDGDWVDIGTDKGDEILAISVKPGRVIIYRSHSIWQHVGDFGDDSARIEPLVPDVGIVGVRAMVSTSLGDYVVWTDGVYKITDWAQKISLKVEPVFRGLATENLPTLGTANRSQCSIGYRNGRLWVSYPLANGNMAGSLILDVGTDRWFNSGSGYRAFFDSGSELLGAGSGVFSVEADYTSATIIMGFQSEYQDCGAPDHEKTWADLVIEHNTRGRDLTVKAKLNKGATTITIATINSSSLTKEIIPLVDGSGIPLSSYNLAISLDGNCGNGSPIVIESPILLHYYLEARQSRRFDSDETDHGTPDVKIVDQVELDTDTPNAGAILQVYSDTPGGVMAPREGSGIPIPTTTGRRMAPIVLTNEAHGRLLRYTVVSPNNQRIYKARARILPIGVYLDGTVGDFWQPTPKSIGV